MFYFMEFFARQCENEISHIKGIDFDQYDSPVAHADSIIFNIYIAEMHRLTYRILDVSNTF